MLRALLTFVVFIGSLAVIGYGVLWYVDNKEVLQKDDVDRSISNIQIQDSPVENLQSEDVEPENSDETKEEVEKEDEEEIKADPASAEKTISKNISILVLNGGGEKGAAGAMSTFLKGKGYAKVEADNAKAYSYTGITLYYQDKDLAEQVEGILEKEYGEVDKQEAQSSGQKLSDIVVVIGE